MAKRTAGPELAIPGGRPVPAATMAILNEIPQSPQKAAAREFGLVREKGSRLPLAFVPFFLFNRRGVGASACSGSSHKRPWLPHPAPQPVLIGWRQRPAPSWWLAFEVLAAMKLHRYAGQRTAGLHLHPPPTGA